MDKNSPIYLYMFRNGINGKAYIGVTKDPDRRFRSHAKGESGSLAFNRAVKKYGIENFSLRILSIFDDVEAANYHENAAIVAFGTLSPKGYNLCGGAPRSQYNGPASLETREKLSLMRLGHFTSQETREKISKANKGRERSLDFCVKCSQAHLGKKLTLETREKMSQARRGKKIKSPSREARQKISESKKGQIPWNKGKKGYKLSPYVRAKTAQKKNKNTVEKELV